MKPQATLLALIILLFGSRAAQGQGFRGSTAAAPRSGTVGQAGSVSRSSSPTSPRPSRAFSAPGSNQQNPSLSVQRSRSGFIREPASPQTASSVTALGPLPSHSARSSAVFAKVPFRHHRHPHFFRHRRILIIGVPSFTGTTIVTNGGWTQQRMAGIPFSDGRTSSADQWAPFDPTPQEVVEKILALAGVKKNDVVYDLGSGDGRVVITAAKKYGAKAVGFEIDPGLVKLARENVQREKLEKLVEIRQQDFMTADLSNATVVSLYLSYDGNLALRPKLARELKPGARVVSYAYDMADWQPKVMETYRDAAGETHLLYLWQISEPPLYSENSVQILPQQPAGAGPLLIEVK
jgi:SAM-dependent methyltransferase